MRKLVSNQIAICIAIILFLTLAPFLVDTFNSTNRRMFLDLALKGNPYSLAGTVIWFFRGEWPHLEFPYPPITILLEIPGWSTFHLTQSEQVYQLFYKLPLFVSAIITQLILNRISRERNLTGIPFTLARSYILNPAVLLLTTVSGGYEVVGAMLILLAYYLDSHKRTSWSALSLGTAGALRLYPFVLVPIFAIYLWKQDRSNLRTPIRFIVLSLAPLILSCLPFLVLDGAGFVSYLRTQQTEFGPIATIVFVRVSIYLLAWSMGLAFDLSTLPYLFIGMTGLGLAYLYIKRLVDYSSKSSLLAGSMLAVLIFVLFYPKWHGLYWVTFLPLMLIQRQKVTPWVWVPGTIWMLLVNGHFGATGLYYWLAPVTGIWVNSVSPSVGIFFTTLLTGTQAVMIIQAIRETLRPTRQLQPAVSTA